MNKVLICAFHLRKLRPAQGALRLHLVTDYLPNDCRRMFRPWSEWAEVVSCGPTIPASLQAGDVAIATMDDAEQVKQQCEAAGVRCVVPDFGEVGSLDRDLLREVSFFDFEFSGKNEWDGAELRYSAGCLRWLSSVHCRDMYPDWAFEEARGGRPLKVLDIGCGPISVLRWGAIQGDISITGVDPILDMYAMVVARHGFDAMEKIRFDRDVCGFAENLDESIPDEDFDVVYTRNALDHTQQLLKVVDNIGRKLKPGGLAAIEVATREGTRQQWDQLHKTDIWLEKGQLKFAHQDGVAKPLLTAASRLHVKRIVKDTPEWLSVVLEKR